MEQIEQKRKNDQAVDILNNDLDLQWFHNMTQSYKNLFAAAER